MVCFLAQWYQRCYDPVILTPGVFLWRARTVNTHSVKLFFSFTVPWLLLYHIFIAVIYSFISVISHGSAHDILVINQWPLLDLIIPLCPLLFKLLIITTVMLLPSKTTLYSEINDDELALGFLQLLFVMTNKKPVILRHYLYLCIVHAVYLVI